MPDLEALKASGNLPDGMLLASPANPTGVVMADDDVRDICQWCHRNGVRLIMDEIYHGLTFGTKPGVVRAILSPRSKAARNDRANPSEEPGVIAIFAGSTVCPYQSA